MQNANVIRTRPRRKAVAPAREIPWTFILLVIVCACVVAAGFFFAARQHFTSMDYGIKNSKLRDQLENLEAEKRRLLLAREVAMSPISVRKAAREIGLREAAQEVAAVPVSRKRPAEETGAVSITAVKADTKKAETPRIIPTVLTVPAQSKTGGETRRRVVEPRKEKKEKSEVAALLKFR